MTARGDSDRFRIERLLPGSGAWAVVAAPWWRAADAVRFADRLARDENRRRRGRWHATAIDRVVRERPDGALEPVVTLVATPRGGIVRIGEEVEQAA